MICTYCRSTNGETDHRCRRCGRRLLGSAVDAPPELGERAVKALGANALAAAASTAELRLQAERPPVKPTARKPAQSSLFEEPGPKVIPFENARERTISDAETADVFPPVRAVVPKRPAPRRAPSSQTRGEQTTLDFLPTAPQTVRTLKTTVEAMIYCDAPVAAPMHRSIAALLDFSMILIGFGIFLVIFQVFGGAAFGWNKQNLALFGLALALISMFYGFIWTLADRETAGMRWTDLRLLTFNGFPPERRQRALRMVACWLSFASGMIGIFWALLDEENLTWHDHMSKTFPTLRETDSIFVRES